MRLLRSKRGLAALAAVIVVLFLFRPGVYQLRQRIAGSIGSALGRKVSLDNVRIHMLPRPGFDLEGLVIYDDPAFSAEPMVRAQEVSAAIRFRSLFRGRMEIATLSASEPSINLVRNEQGRWNLASLIERSSRMPTAPTGKPASQSRPAFPYLEATNARINFKIGQAKKSLALADADVALWQDGENSWGARMKAQPVRTDFNLTDTGIIQINASWQRAASLGDTPVEVAVRWQKGQLGQLTKLFSGRDRGWRGGVNLSATLTGTPRGLQVKSELDIDELRRYDIMSTGVRLAGACAGRYSTEDNTLQDLQCEAPVQAGTVRLRGNIGPMPIPADYDLTLDADKVPLASILQLVRQTKKALPADLAASGQLTATVHAVRAHSGSTVWSGEGTAAGVRLASNGGKDEIVFGDVPLLVRDGNAKHGRAKAEEGPAEAYLRVGPVSLAMGGAAPATASAWLSASGYRLGLRGDTDVKSLYRLSNAVGVSGFHPVAEGTARVDLGVVGIWQGFAAPQALGTAQLRNVRTGMRGLNPEIDIVSAAVKLEPEIVSVEKIVAQTGDTHWNGTVRVPRHCGAEGCVFQFDLGADQLSGSAFVDWFTPRPNKRPWYRILSASEPQGPSPLLAVRARGRVRAARLSLYKIETTEISSQVEIAGGKVTLSGLRLQLLEGSQHGDWVIDASSLPPHYQGSGELMNVSLASVSTAMNDEWVTGTGDAKFSVNTSGNSFTDVLAHAQGQLQFSVRNGMLAHIAVPDSAKPLPIHTLTGTFQLQGGAWTLGAGRLQSHDGLYQVKGTAAPGKGVNFLLTRGDEQAWTVTGSLTRPNVTRVPHTEARVK